MGFVKQTFGLAKSEPRSHAQPYRDAMEWREGGHIRPPKKITELKKSCSEEWIKIPPEWCTSVIYSYSKSLPEVIAASGYQIKFFYLLSTILNECVHERSTYYMPHIYNKCVQ